MCAMQIAKSPRSPSRTNARGAQVASRNGLSGALLAVMTVSAGVGIANLYYNQPLLDQMGRSLGASAAEIGMAPTLTQVGYSVGMLFLVPLGDMLQRRRLVLLFTLITALLSICLATSMSTAMLLGMSFLLGLANMTPQLLVPFAATLAGEHDRGRVVGLMVSGVLLGVLLSRTVAGFVGAGFGWRVMFGLAAALMFAVLGILSFMLPATKASYHGSYGSLLRSVWTLVCEQPVLREACLFGGMLFGAFMVFWANLIHLLSAGPFHLGPRAVGLYGLLGAGAAVMSPIVGRMAGKGSARTLAGAMVLLTIASFGVFWFGRSSLIWIGVGVLAMDLGVQLGHVSNQTRILSLAPNAQSRIQTAYMSCYFAGGGIGAALGSLAWSRRGWGGVCLAAIAMLILPLVRWMLPLRTQSARQA
jgi:predicted MFS family arabinose efflux permease